MKEIKTKQYILTVIDLTTNAATEYIAKTIKELSEKSGYTVKELNNRLYGITRGDDIIIEKKTIITIPITKREKIKYSIQVDDQLFNCKNLIDGAKVLKCSVSRMHKIIKTPELITKYNIIKNE